MGSVGEVSVIGISLMIALVAVQVLFRWIDQRGGNGNGKKWVVQCPNKIDRLAETLHNLEIHISRTSEDAGICKVGVEQLVESHAPVNGVEQWKIQPRIEEMLEKSLEYNRELLELQKRSVAAVEQLVSLQMRSNGQK